MWRLRLWSVYLWKIRPRVVFTSRLSMHVRWRLCQARYDPVKRARLRAAVSTLKEDAK